MHLIRLSILSLAKITRKCYDEVTQKCTYSYNRKVDEMKLDEKTELEKLRVREEKRKARVKRQNEAYNAKNDRVSFDVPKGKKDEIRAAAEKQGVSVNAFVSSVVLREAETILSQE